LRLPAQIVAVTAGAGFAALHAALAGFNVPAQRALWMAGVVALAFVSGRELARSVVLAWALGLVLLIDPWAVVSAGFWLSFCAVAAILFAVSGRPVVRGRRQGRDGEDGGERVGEGEGQGERHREGDESTPRTPLRRRICTLAERLRRAAHVQIAVTLALAPVTVYWFSQIPLTGPLANAFAIPWVSLLVTPAVLAGIVLPVPLDAWLWHTANRLLDLLAVGLQMLSGPAWALWRLPQPDAWTLAAATLGAFWCLAPRGWPLRWAAPLTWLPLLMPAPPGPPPGSFRLTALDVGQGSSVLVQTAHHALLFDAGPGPESTHAGERVVVPFLQAHGIAALDTLIISHADSDHSGGAPAVFDAIEVHQLVAALAPGNVLWSSARQHGAQTVPCAAGQHWQWDGVELAILWPDAGPLQGKPNDHCCVLRVRTMPRAGRGSGVLSQAVAPATAAAPGQAAGSRGTAAVRESAPLPAMAPLSRTALPPQPAPQSEAARHAQTSEPPAQPAPPPIAALLSADIEAPAERVLLARDRGALRAQVLVVPHHGSKTSSTEPFLDAIEPSIALFQVGYRNRFQHPNKGVFERYKARHIELGRSDADGAVRVDMIPGPSGATLTVERYRDTRRRYWMDR
jgi:competence protein ComEC